MTLRRIAAAAAGLAAIAGVWWSGRYAPVDPALSAQIAGGALLLGLVWGMMEERA